MQNWDVVAEVRGELHWRTGATFCTCGRARWHQRREGLETIGQNYCRVHGGAGAPGARANNQVTVATVDKRTRARQEARAAKQVQCAGDLAKPTDREAAEVTKAEQCKGRAKSVTGSSAIVVVTRSKDYKMRARSGTGRAGTAGARNRSIVGAEDYHAGVRRKCIGSEAAQGSAVLEDAAHSDGVDVSTSRYCKGSGETAVSVSHGTTVPVVRGRNSVVRDALGVKPVVGEEDLAGVGDREEANNPSLWRWRRWHTSSTTNADTAVSSKGIQSTAGREAVVVKAARAEEDLLDAAGGPHEANAEAGVGAVQSHRTIAAVVDNHASRECEPVGSISVGGDEELVDPMSREEVEGMVEKRCEVHAMANAAAAADGHARLRCETTATKPVQVEALTELVDVDEAKVAKAEGVNEEQGAAVTAPPVEASAAATIAHAGIGREAAAEADLVKAANEPSDVAKGKQSKARFSASDIREMMGKPACVRNLSVIAHVDHGKSTLTDQLVCRAGIIGEGQAGQMRYTDTRPDEQQRGITIKSTGISLCFETDGQAHLINLVDSPGHVDFSSEVTAALRITDGALVVVDCIEGVCVQTDTVLRQALRERIKPVLMLNKLDRPILELQSESEEIYQRLCRSIEDVNVIISGYALEGTDIEQVSPHGGTICFGSGLQGWAFCLDTFAKIYSAKFGMTSEKMVDRLWGDHFFDASTKKWSRSGGNRGFCQFVLDPIIQIAKHCSDGAGPKLFKMISSLGVKLKSCDERLDGKKLFKRIMHLWVPAADALLGLIVNKLPSPVCAQQYRTPLLYEGPQNDAAAVAIRNCDPNGPLMMFITKLVPAGDTKRFYAFGRIFSGTATAGQKVRIQGPDYVPVDSREEAGSKGDQDLQRRTTQRVVLMMGRSIENLGSAPAGNLVALVGIDQSIIKTATITTLETAYNISSLKFTVAPVVQISVKPQSPKDLPKLVDAMSTLTKSDPLVVCSINESGEHVIAGAGELHVEVCLRDLRQYVGQPIEASPPSVSYRETVTARTESTILAKSANKHNRFFVTAEPLSDELIGAVESRPEFLTHPNRARIIANEFGWDKGDAQRIWCFGPDFKGPNCFVNQATAVPYVNEIVPHVVSGFQWATRQGPICEEPLRGNRFNLEDCLLHSDAIHRGPAQLLGPLRKSVYGSLLSSEPRLMEPLYRMDVSCHNDVVSTIHRLVASKRGEVVDEQHHASDPMVDMVSHLPVSESFGFATLLAEETSGRALAQCTFSHWNVMEGDPLCYAAGVQPTKVYGLVKQIRKRKGLVEEPPAPMDFIDKL